MDLESNSELDHANAMGQARAEIARLKGDLAKEREKFTMHTAHVHAWLSAVVQELGIAKTHEIIDVATVCSEVMDHVKVATAVADQFRAIEKASTGLDRGRHEDMVTWSARLHQRLLDIRSLSRAMLDDGGRNKPLGFDDAEQGMPP